MKNTTDSLERLPASAGSVMSYEDGCKAIHAKMQAERPTLREYLRQMCAASDKASHEWEAAHPGCQQAAYRNGMWYAYRDIERMMERDGFNSENAELKTAREKVVSWVMSLGLATGHGDTLDDILKEAGWQVKELAAASRGSEVDSAEAVKGYMNTRQALCVALSEISSTYERETTRHKRIIEEIVRIDACVKDILNSQNDQADSPRSGG